MSGCIFPRMLHAKEQWNPCSSFWNRKVYRCRHRRHCQQHFSHYSLSSAIWNPSWAKTIQSLVISVSGHNHYDVSIIHLSMVWYYLRGRGPWFPVFFDPGLAKYFLKYCFMDVLSFTVQDTETMKCCHSKKRYRTCTKKLPKFYRLHILNIKELTFWPRLLQLHSICGLPGETQWISHRKTRTVKTGSGDGVGIRKTYSYLICGYIGGR